MFMKRILEHLKILSLQKQQTLENSKMGKALKSKIDTEHKVKMFCTRD